MSRIDSTRAEDDALVPREFLQPGKIDVCHFDLHNQSLHFLDDLRFSLASIRVDIRHKLMFDPEIRNRSFDLVDFEFIVLVVQMLDIVSV